jgi:hypothetical protein
MAVYSAIHPFTGSDGETELHIDISLLSCCGAENYLKRLFHGNLKPTILDITDAVEHRKEHVMCQFQHNVLFIINTLKKEYPNVGMPVVIADY